MSFDHFVSGLVCLLVKSADMVCHARDDAQSTKNMAASMKEQHFQRC